MNLGQIPWHIEDQGNRHVCIKPRNLNLNGRVERSHSTDEQEFYSLLTYTTDVDLNKKLAEWETSITSIDPTKGLTEKHLSKF